MGEITFSLLWKDASQKHSLIPVKHYKELCDDLEFGEILNVISREPLVKITPETLIRNITTDYSDITFRQGIVKYLLLNTNSSEIIENLLVDLTSLDTLAKKLKSDFKLENIILRIRKLFLFSSIYSKLKDLFSTSNSSDDNLEFLSTEIINTIEQVDLVKMNDDLEKMKSLLKKYQSIDIGVNFDTQFCIKEAVAINVNNFTYSSGGILNKLEAKKEMVDSNPIIKESDISNSPHILTICNAIYKDLENAMGKELNYIEHKIEKYSAINTSKLLFLKEELVILYGALRLFTYLAKNSCPHCFPIKAKDSISIRDFISIPILQKTLFSETSDDLMLVRNTVEPKKGENSLIITGPNGGGKTILIQSLVSMQILFQTGFPIPAFSAKMKTYDSIFTHFPSDEDMGKGTGRLGEEIQRISALIREKSYNTLLAMNEPFITTSPEEGLEILVLALQKLNAINIDLYVVTHYLEIFNVIDEKQTYHSLVMEIVNGKRSYRALNQEPMAESFARDIARKYRIDMKSVLADRRNRVEE